MCVCVGACVGACVGVCGVHACMSVCVSAYMSLCICVCMCLRVFVHTSKQQYTILSYGYCTTYIITDENKFDKHTLVNLMDAVTIIKQLLY